MIRFAAAAAASGEFEHWHWEKQTRLVSDCMSATENVVFPV
jgi:hypothetical protein